jgi:hypothetical protein
MHERSTLYTRTSNMSKIIQNTLYWAMVWQEELGYPTLLILLEQTRIEWTGDAGG